MNYTLAEIVAMERHRSKDGRWLAAKDKDGNWLFYDLTGKSKRAFVASMEGLYHSHSTPLLPFDNKPLNVIACYARKHDGDTELYLYDVDKNEMLPRFQRLRSMSERVSDYILPSLRVDWKRE